jgi:hypothetical protein
VAAVSTLVRNLSGTSGAVLGLPLWQSCGGLTSGSASDVESGLLRLQVLNRLFESAACQALLSVSKMKALSDLAHWFANLLSI